MFILRFFSKLIFWDYRRGSWQHEFLCLAFIAALIFLPTNSNGWFSEGEEVKLADKSVITLHRYNTSLYLNWEAEESEPGHEALREFAEARFGKDVELIRDSGTGPYRFRIIPRGLR